MPNPLLVLDSPPDFRAIDPASIEPAIQTLIARAQAALVLAAGDTVPARFEALSAALDPHLERLDFAWGVVAHLQAVADTPALRKSYQACLPQVTAFYTALGANLDLYWKRRAIAAGAGLPPPRRRALALTMEAAQLSGVELEGADKQRFAAIQDRCALLSQRFATNLLDATDRYACYVHENEMDGVPADVFDAARAAARAEGREGCKLGLQLSTYAPVMRHASNRALRERLYHASTTRASEFGPPELDNLPLMQELIALRQERARLLGLDSHAHVSLAPKMARDPDQVIGFLHELAKAARPAAARELGQLRSFARDELRLATLEAWDLPFVGECLRQARYAFSEDEVKRYFSVDQVLDGLLGLARRLFGIRIERAELPVWHDSVHAYRVWRKGQELGVFYLDLYARPGKRSGAWVNGLQPRWRSNEHVRTALACLVCNFAPPDQRGVALLGHDNLVTLFHEFGHKLHFLLSSAEDLGVSGFSGVEWDAVELPSQLMENLAWEWEVLEPLSGHVDDGSRLPRALFDKMRAARNFMGGVPLLRQIEMALFDMRLHACPDAGSDILALLERVRSEVSPMPVPAYNRFANGFTHIFAGAYAAGYYSYLWAEVLSADAWSAFEEAGVLHQPTWDRFREAVLEVGGSRPAADSFLAFRGRAASQAALLRQRGLDAGKLSAAAA